MNNNHLGIEIPRPSHAEIAARAYELFVQRGWQEGHATDDWLQAESELLQLAAHKMSIPATPILEVSAPVKAPKTQTKQATRR